MKSGQIRILYWLLWVCVLAGLIVIVTVYTNGWGGRIPTGTFENLVGFVAVFLAPFCLVAAVITLRADKNHVIARKNRVALLLMSIILFCMSTVFGLVVFAIFVYFYTH